MELITPESQGYRQRKKKSAVWEYFTIETVNDACRRAICNQCSQSFAYSIGSKVSGTSHLKRHIHEGTCLSLLRNEKKKNKSNPKLGIAQTKRCYRSAVIPLDQDRCRHEIAMMIIMHDYPLHMVEDPGFIAFVQNLQPRFDKLSFNTVQQDCIATYLKEKQNVMNYMKSIPGRVCLTLDLWKSSQTTGYVFITGHFVDNDWKLQRRLLNVVMEPYPDSETALAHSVAVCISDWGLEGKLFSLTINHEGGGDGALRPHLCANNPFVINGQLLITDCVATTFTTIAKRVLSAGEGIITKIRNIVKYVKTSHEEKFLEIKQKLQVQTEKTLFIDDETQWNTTYMMLVSASEFKEVFDCFFDCKEASPSMEEWKQIETLSTFLKPLFDASNVLMVTKNPTATTFFHEVWKIQWAAVHSIISDDPFTSYLAKVTEQVIAKYWNNCSLVLAIVVVMDPRLKMKLVEFCFSKIYGDHASTYIKMVDDGIRELFLEYVSVAPNYMNVKREECLGLTDFDAYMMQTTGHLMKSELDQYLEECLLPRVMEFDVLDWWKVNKIKYPTLSRMASDILSIPVSTLSSDSVFCLDGKEMDSYRSSLSPDTLEAIICAKDWFQHDSMQLSQTPLKLEYS